LAGKGTSIERHFAGSTQAPEVWLDFHLQHTPRLEPPTDIPSDEAAVLYFTAESKLTVLDGGGNGGGAWSVVSTASPEWNRLSLRMNYSTQRWAIWLNNIRVAENLGFAYPVPFFSGFTVQHSALDAARFDDFS